MEKNVNTLPETNTDFEVRSLDAVCVNESQLEHHWWHNLKYLLAGMFFALLLIKGEVISWYRIQEMFRFQSFHMYGIIGSAVAVGILSVYLIRRFNIKTIYGEKIEIHSRQFNKGQVIGGLLFGAGWALTGACPGPLYALIGAGIWPVIIILLSAIAGTWVYGCFRDRLPH